MSIFISHSSKNSEIVRNFVQLILYEGLGVEKGNIFCTSIQDAGIQSGEDFKNRIKDEISNCDIVIQIISEDYKESEVCLNEMGAAWALNKIVIPFILPPVNFENVGFIHSTSQLLRLNNYNDLTKFRIDHGEKLNGKLNEEVVFNKAADRFSKLPEIIHLNKPFITKKINDKDINSFFNSFLDPNINHHHIMIKAQPNLADCKAIFRDEYYSDIYSLYSIFYRSATLLSQKWEDIYTKDIFEYRLFEVDGEKKGYPEKEVLIQKYFKPYISFYDIAFKKLNHEYGVNLTGWIHINERWVFFPKPLKIISTIEEVKNMKFLKRLQKMLGIMGVKKELKSTDLELEYIVTHLINELKK